MTEVIPDMVGLVGCYMAYAALALLAVAVAELEGALNFHITIPHIKTFHVNIGTQLFGAAHKELESWKSSVEHWAIRFEQDIVTMFEVLVALPILAAEGSYKGLQALWTVALDKAVSPALNGIRSSVSTVSNSVASISSDIYNTATPLPAKIGHAITSAVNGAISTAEGYTDTAITSVRSDLTKAEASLGQQIAQVGKSVDNAISTAEGYTDTAVAGLKSIEDKAISAASDLASAAQASATSLFNTAETDAKNLSASAVTYLEGLIQQGVQGAESAASSALSAAQTGLTNAIAGVDNAASTGIAAARADAATALQAAVNTAQQAISDLGTATDQETQQARDLAADVVNAASVAASTLVAQAEQITGTAVTTAESLASAGLAEVRAVAVPIGEEVQPLAGAAGLVGVAALIASIPGIATFVNALATDTGLENESCRSKVKGICGTDPNAWANLLGGLAAVGFAFSLAELASVAEDVIDPLVDVIEQAA